MEFFFTLGLFGFCMAIMAIGLLFKRKPLVKDCGLDPISGERISDCASAAQGKPQCLKRQVLNLFTSKTPSNQDEPTPPPTSEKVVLFPEKKH